MDALGVATGILTPGLEPAACRRRSRSPTRTRAASSSPACVVDPGTADAATCGASASSPSTRASAMVRVAPLFDAGRRSTTPKHYPIYQVCEELGLPVGINVGIPGPRVRSRVQHPELLEDVLIDFPDLVVIGAHMGHPYEELLMNYMRKWPNLYLSCTAYAPQLPRPEPRRVHEHVDVPRPRALGQRRPVVPDAALARRGPALPLDDEAMALFLGGTARRLLDRTTH